MHDTIQSAVVSIAVVLVVALICGSALYGCVNNNQQYYAAMKSCVDSGGAAVPTSNGNGGSIVCIRK